MTSVNEIYRKMILSVLGLFEKSPPLYTFDELIEDLCGFASNEEELIAFLTDLFNDPRLRPVLISHEAGHYLIGKDPQNPWLLKLELKGRMKLD